MKLKELEIALQQVDGFEEPKVELEQYATTPHLAARLLFTADSVYGDIGNKAVCDLGCGSGMLTVGCIMLGSCYNVGFEIDEDAAEVARNNLNDFEMDADVVLWDVRQPVPTSLVKKFDTVVMNPPFGTKDNRGIDMIFLQRALELSSGAVYSLHKTTTREHILKKASDWGVRCDVLAELRFDLQASYKFHKKKSVDIAVDLIRLSHKASAAK